MSDSFQKIESKMVPDESRMRFLPRYFGSQFNYGETMIYQWADRLSSDYNGGSWNFFELTNGGFYVAPAHVDRVMRVQWHLNGFDDVMSADAFGVVVTLFALCQLAEKTGDDQPIDLYYALRAYAMTHPEVRKIARAID
jgi:hypothetical protein